MSVTIQDLTPPTITINGTVVPNDIVVSNSGHTTTVQKQKDYAKPVTVALTSSYSDAKIHYTTSGRNPTKKSTLYTAPLVLTGNLSGSGHTVIKARVYRYQSDNRETQLGSPIVRVALNVFKCTD